VWWVNHAHTSRALPFGNLILKGLNARPMDFRSKMMFGVITVIEPDPVIEPVIATHAPRDWLIGIAAVVPVSHCWIWRPMVKANRVFIIATRFHVASCTSRACLISPALLTAW